MSLLAFTGCQSNGHVATQTVKVIEDASSEIETKMSPNTKTPEVISPDTKYYNTYNVKLDINPKTRGISGVEKVTYKNNTGKDLNKIYFHLYLNAFSASSTKKPYFEEFKSNIFKYGQDTGALDIKYIYINNNEVKFEQKGTTLKVNLPQNLKSGEQTEITLQFESYIPRIAHRTGANEHAIWLGNYLPTLCVYDQSGWRTDSYYAAGDSFYSDISNYVVKVTAPKEYTVIGTGEEAETEQNGSKVTTITAEMVRDFAMAIDFKYNIKTLKTSKGVNINFYSYSDGIDDVEQKLLLAEKTIDYYSGKLGSYPYTELDIVETELFDEVGIDYPAFIMMDSTSLKRTSGDTIMMDAIGHEWFYNIIGSDQINEAWLDEGLNGYMQEKMLHENLDSRFNLEYKILEAKRSTLSNMTLDTSLSQFKDWSSYYYTQYVRGKLMMYSLNEKMGDSNFDALLKTYYKKYAFKTATAKDFIGMAEDIYGRSLKTFFEKWIKEEEIPKLILGGE
jgi:hypothetical protein